MLNSIQRKDIKEREIDRFFSFVTALDEDQGECWAWHGSLLRNGYAQFRHTKGSLAHKFSYVHFVGEIAEGLSLDHLCRNRWCVNPLHLEPVTTRENIMRSPIALATINAAKTHCKRNHPLSGYNLIMRNGWRVCRECKNTGARLRRSGAK